MERADWHLHIRVQGREVEAWKAAATRCEMVLSEWVRETLNLQAGPRENRGTKAEVTVASERPVGHKRCASSTCPWCR